MPHRLLKLITPRGHAATNSVATMVTPTAIGRNKDDRKAVYAKVFRYSPAHAHDHDLKRVEVVGSFTNWQPVAMTLNPQDHTWQVTVENIEGNKTHHYMLLANGHPANDRLCDGYAVPSGDIEKRYALTTPRGPRLFLLFAQTK
jgi:hypothetical protein